jgi:hypothetical protein
MRTPVPLLAPLALLALAAGCRNESAFAPENGVPVVPDLRAVEIEATPDAAPVTALVRRLGPFSVAVGGDPVEVTVDGSPVVVDIDPSGYGALVLEGEGVVPLADTDRALEPAFVFPAALPELPLLRASEGELASQVVPVQAGAVAAVGDALWWSGAGLPDHVVARLPAQVAGLRAAQVDGDGVADVITWGGEAVVLLRARAGGGLGWGFALQAPGWTAAGAGVGDLDGDGDADLIVDWRTPEGHVVQLWSGDGLWNFEAEDERPVLGDTLDLVVARDRAADSPVATRLIEEGDWQRYVRGAQGGLQVTGPAVDPAPVPGSRLYAGGDFNGDGLEELVVQAPRRDRDIRRLVLYDLEGDSFSTLAVEESGAWTGFADVDADGLTDLLLLEDTSRRLDVMVFQDTRYVVREAAVVAPFGPPAASDIDDDGVRDLFLAGDRRWAWWPGRIEADDLDRWRPLAPAGTTREERLTGDLHAWRSFDGILQAVALTGGGDDTTRLSRWQLGGEAPVDVPGVGLDADGAPPVDLDVCGDQAWALVGPQAIRIDLVALSVGLRRDITADVGTPDAVACDPTDEAAGALVLGDGGWVHLGPDGTVLATGDEVAPDGALLDGVPTPCEGACVAWPLGEAGTALVTATEDGLEVDLADRSLVRGGGPSLALQDLDGDGLPELLTRDADGFVGVVRALDGEIAPTRWALGRPAWQGPPVVDPLGTGLLSRSGTALAWTGL